MDCIALVSFTHTQLPSGVTLTSRLLNHPEFATHRPPAPATSPTPSPSSSAPPAPAPSAASATRLLDVFGLCLSLSVLDKEDERPRQHSRQPWLLVCAAHAAQFVTLPFCHSANSMQRGRVVVSP